MSNNDPHDRSIPIPKSSVKSLALKYAKEVAAAYGQLIEEVRFPSTGPNRSCPIARPKSGSALSYSCLSHSMLDGKMAWSA